MHWITDKILVASRRGAYNLDSVREHGVRSIVSFDGRSVEKFAADHKVSLDRSFLFLMANNSLRNFVAVFGQIFGSILTFNGLNIREV